LHNHLHPAALDNKALIAECDVRHARRSGPGGQRRNKVETAVVLTHRPTGIIAEASERRSQAENLVKALFRLRLKLAVQVRRLAAADHKPSPLWQSRCRDGRVSVNPEHEDFPALLAEALDVLASRNMDVQAAAQTLGCSGTQLVKLLKHEPAALELDNNARSNRGLDRLL
jgi:hypothetical protein